MARRPVKAIVVLLPRRATLRRVEGGAGSKRCVLGCDPVTRQEAHRFHAIHAHLHGHIPASEARRRAEEGSLWDLTPQTRIGIGMCAPMIGSTVASPQAGPLLWVAPIPAPRYGAPPILATTLRAGTSFGL